MDCPICGTVMKRQTYYLEHILMSESHDCPNGCYNFDYDAGSYRVKIGEREWIFVYTTPDNSYHKIQVDLNLAIEKAKKEQALCGTNLKN
jgi:hypothetical protein